MRANIYIYIYFNPYPIKILPLSLSLSLSLNFDHLTSLSLNCLIAASPPPHCRPMPPAHAADRRHQPISPLLVFFFFFFYGLWCGGGCGCVGRSASVGGWVQRLSQRLQPMPPSASTSPTQANPSSKLPIHAFAGLNVTNPS